MAADGAAGGPRDFPDFFPLPTRRRDVNMAGEARFHPPVRGGGGGGPAQPWYSTPSAKIKEQTPRHTIVETFLTLAPARREIDRGSRRGRGIKGSERMLRNGEATAASRESARDDGGERERGEEKRRNGVTDGGAEKER